ncbi:fra [Bugula neritina]|uniref:Fra n=1 Tax=Bugula neritina TaxID=10212 RepID=A0A7J7JFG2_BUGNE|nr:fra [Bugula neritina]
MEHSTIILIACIIGPSFATFDFTIVPRDTSVVVGQQASLSCSATYNNGTPDVYSWERNGELLSMRSTGVNKLILTNGSIVFSSITDSGASPDTGSYRCIAEKIGSGGKVHRIATPEVFLRSAYMGDFTIQPADVSLSAGENAMFECRTNGLPASTYTWTKDGNPISTSEDILTHGDGEVLEVQSVAASAEGSYQCHATNVAGVKQSSSAYLSVQPAAGGSTAPAFIVRPRDVSVKKGSKAILYCAVTGLGASGNKPVLTWLRSGSTINIAESGGHYQLLGGGSLQINNVGPADEGKYTCRGDNLIDISDAEATVTVLVAPYFATRPANTEAYVNGDAELKCDIRGYPLPTVSWLKNSNYVNIDQYSRMVGGNLNTMALMPSDAGYYQCIGVNSVGSVFATAELTVLVDGDADTVSTVSRSPLDLTNYTHSGLPLPPASLQAVLISYTYITLSWESSSTPEIPVSGYTVSAVSLSDPAASARLRTASTTSTDYTMQGLQPDTNYLFRIYAYNSKGRSLASQELTVRTNAEVAVPGPVGSINITHVSEDSLGVAWDEPSNTNGPITEYKIFYYSTDQSKESNMSSVLASALIENLDPYTQYRLRVVAYNGNGEGMPSSEVPVRTLSTRPSAAPLRVSAQPTGVYSIMLKWSPPPPDTVNGQLTGYKIRYKAKDSFGRASSYTTDADARSHEVGGLDPGTTYLIRVGAVNINGTGVLSDWVEASTYSASLEESRPPGRPIKLTLQPFPRELIVSWIPADDNILIKGYKLGYGTITPDAHWVDIESHLRLTTLTNLQSKSNYVVQLFAYNAAGEGARIEQQTYTTEETTSSTSVAVNTVETTTGLPALSPPHGVETRVMSSSSIIVTWTDGTLGGIQENIDGRIYRLKYHVVSGSSHRRPKYIDTSDFVVHLKKLKPATKYEFAVMVTRNDRSSLYSFSTTNTTLEDAPATAPSDLTVSSSDRGHQYVHISWQPPSQPNGNIISYQIFSSTDDTLPIKQWARDAAVGSSLNYQYGQVTANTRYYFLIVAQTKVGSSPASEVVSFKTPKADRKSTFLEGVSTVGVIAEPVDPSLSLLQKSPYLIWIIIVSVAVISIIAIAVITAVLCCRKNKSTKQQRSPAKHTTQPPDLVAKPNPPDLWIDHERHELTGLRLQSETDNETDERTSMLQSNFDVSVSLAGDMTYPDDMKFSSLTRSGRPVIIASNPHRDAMPRASVTPMTADSTRPLYPRTQFASGGQHGATPRVHVGDTSQPSSGSHCFQLFSNESVLQ